MRLTRHVGEIQCRVGVRRGTIVAVPVRRIDERFTSSRERLELFCEVPPLWIQWMRRHHGVRSTRLSMGLQAFCSSAELEAGFTRLISHDYTPYGQYEIVSHCMYLLSYGL